MTSPFHLILWAAPGRSHQNRLLGRPVWERTRNALAKLAVRETILVTDARSETLEEDGVLILPRARVGAALKRLKGRTLILPAELPCLRAGSLSPLLRRKRDEPARLAGPPTEAPIIGGQAGALSRHLDRLRGRPGLERLADGLPHVTSSLANAEDFVHVIGGEAWVRATMTLRRRKCDELVRRGVLIEDPSTVQVDPEVQVGRATRLRGWVVLEGATRIGAHCEIGCFTHVIDSTIGAGTMILDHCYIRSSEVGRRVQVGPFAHLRPESIVGSNAKVGNFVELKKTVLGAGSKAPHLTYLGDARIGRNVNVGAGTITCNYDGRAKHPTIVEDGAFIGSDVQLVAPVRVGRGAYVAAGSCIVEDVAPGALAVARSRQTTKPRWAAERKKRKSQGRGSR